MNPVKTTTQLIQSKIVAKTYQTVLFMKITATKDVINANHLIFKYYQNKNAVILKYMF